MAEEKANGTGSHAKAAPAAASNKATRFELPMISQEDLELDLEILFDGTPGSITEITTLFTLEEAAAEYWLRATLALFKNELFDKSAAFKFGELGVETLSRKGKAATTIQLICFMASLRLKMAAKAPKLKLETALEDTLTGDDAILRSEYQEKAAAYIQQAKGIDRNHPVLLETEIAFFLAKGDLDSASSIVKTLLDAEPRNPVAKLAQARIYLAKRQFALALRSFQTLLRNSPQMLPDPRIGIGLCYWHLGDRRLAEKAWQRSIKFNPGVNSLGAQLLLSISWINASKKDDAQQETSQSADSLYIEGIKLVTDVFKLSDKTSPMAAAVLSDHMVLQSNVKMATKLSERAIQFSDNKMISAEGHYKLGRILHAKGDFIAASSQYTQAIRDRPEFTPAKIAQAHLLMERGSIPEAENTLVLILERQPQCIEAQAGLAAIHANAAYSAMSVADAQAATQKATEAYEQILRVFTTLSSQSRPLGSKGLHQRIQAVAQDAQLYAEIGRIWMISDQTRALKAFKTAVEVQTDAGLPVQAQILNNIGCLEFAKKEYESAQSSFEAALTNVGHLQDDTEREAAATTCSYNLAQVYELNDENVEKAREVYEKRLLSRHPEWTDARLALLHIRRKEFDQADELLKEALTSSHKNPELRALYLYYLLETRQDKWARDFATATIRDFSTSDVYANCALAMILYNQAREIRPANAEQAKDKAGKHVQSAEFYSRALKYDPKCAFAAQGMAIVLAEGSLANSATDQAAKLKASRDALAILTKVRDTLNDASVYINIGHLHAARDEWEKAIENYTTASNRFYKGNNSSCLLYLARAWFQKANKSLDYNAINRSLEYAGQAAAKQPEDDAIKFNIAIIQHKGLEVLTNLPPERRTMQNIRDAIEQATQANATFASLAANKSKQVSYPIEMAEQRTRYGANLVSRAASEALPVQETYESTEQAKLDRAKAARDADKAAQAAAQTARLEEIRLRNETLAASRREMQEQAASWYQRDAYDSDEAKKAKRGRGKKQKEGDFVVADGEEEEKPKRPTKRKSTAKSKKAKQLEEESKENSEQSQDDDETMPQPPAKRAKQFKSTEFVGSDDDE